jgi:hypothetical protein
MSVRWQKNGSFGFAKGWLVCQAKPNVLKCAVGCLFTMRHNVSTLGEVGDFGKLNCQPTRIYNRSKKFQ